MNGRQFKLQMEPYFVLQFMLFSLFRGQHKKLQRGSCADLCRTTGRRQRSSTSAVEVFGLLLYSFITSANNASETQNDNLFCQERRDDI